MVTRATAVIKMMAQYDRLDDSTSVFLLSRNCTRWRTHACQASPQPGPSSWVASNQPSGVICGRTLRASASPSSRDTDAVSPTAAARVGEIDRRAQAICGSIRRSPPPPRDNRRETADRRRRVPSTRGARDTSEKDRITGRAAEFQYCPCRGAKKAGFHCRPTSPNSDRVRGPRRERFTKLFS